MKLFSRMAKTPPPVPIVGHASAARRQAESTDVGYEAALPFLSSQFPETTGRRASSKWANWRRRWWAGRLA
jgi:hypothetical protein